MHNTADDDLLDADEYDEQTDYPEPVDPDEWDDDWYTPSGYLWEDAKVPRWARAMGKQRAGFTEADALKKHAAQQGTTSPSTDGTSPKMMKSQPKKRTIDGHFVPVPTWLSRCGHALTPTERAVYTALLGRREWRDSGERKKDWTYVAAETVAIDIGAERTTVTRALRFLEAVGLIKRKRISRNAACYFVVTEEPPEFHERAHDERKRFGVERAQKAHRPRKRRASEAHQ